MTFNYLAAGHNAHIILFCFNVSVERSQAGQASQSQVIHDSQL